MHQVSFVRYLYDNRTRRSKPLISKFAMGRDLKEFYAASILNKHPQDPSTFCPSMPVVSHPAAFRLFVHFMSPSDNP
jgi:hypothetical protein